MNFSKEFAVYLLKDSLKDSRPHDWSYQGLGMLRLRLNSNTRLHIWDTRFAVPGASPIHDHLQWSLLSEILWGTMRNTRFDINPLGNDYMYATLKPGEGCFFKHNPRLVGLNAKPTEVYQAGDQYSQQPEEVHLSEPAPGTVTVVHQRRTTDPDSARVFWPAGTNWGSAEPRRATSMEIIQFVNSALWTLHEEETK
jgi:hypothetical protein